jgi:hypothetical protein
VFRCNNRHIIREERDIIMAAKKMKDARRVDEIKHLGYVMLNQVDKMKKTSEAIEFQANVLSKMLAFLVVPDVDELKIAKYWIYFEDEIKRLRGVEVLATQLVLQPTEQGKKDAKKQGRDNTK